MGEQSFISIVPPCYLFVPRLARSGIFFILFLLIISNSFGPLDRGTFPAVPVR